MKKVLSLIIVLILALLVGTSFAQAGVFGDAQKTLDDGGQAAYGGPTESNLPIVIGKIVNGILIVSGVLLTIIVLYGGFLYMTAGGESKNVDKAKDWLKNGIIGLIIVLLAYSIASFVMGNLISATAKAGG